MSKPRELYINSNDVDVCVSTLDLNESHQNVEVYLYPHKDNLTRLTKFIEYKALKAEQEKSQQLLKHLISLESYDPYVTEVIEKAIKEYEGEIKC